MAALDHATLLVGNLSQAALFLEERLGFRLTVTPQAPETHGRIFLDRTYVEVSSGDGRGTGEGLPLLSEWSMYFLRTADPQAFVELARDYGLQPSGPAIYHGHDGDWLDVELRASVPSYLLPGVIQRISPLAVAANWPPPLAEPHPNGAERLAAVYVLAQDKNQAEALVETLSCVAAADVAAADLQAVQWRLIPYFQAFRKSVPIADGGRVDILYASQPGLAASWLEGHGPGILAAAFATASLERTRATLVDRGYPAEEQWVGGHFLWLQPKGALGVHIGFEG